MVTPTQYQWLESLGYHLEVDAEKTTWLGIDAPLDPRFYYFDDYYTNPNGLYIVDFVQEVNTNWPDHVELIDAGNGGDGYYSPGGWVKDRAGGQSSIAQLADVPLDGLGYNSLWGLCTPNACGGPRSHGQGQIRTRGTDGETKMYGDQNPTRRDLFGALRGG